MLFNINRLRKMCNTFNPMRRALRQTGPAALMGPGDQPAFGGAGGLWRRLVTVTGRGPSPLAMSLLAPPARKRSGRQPGQKAVSFFMLNGGMWRATPDVGLFQTAGPLTLCVPWNSMTRPETGRGDGEGCRSRRAFPAAAAQMLENQLFTTEPTTFSEM